VELDDPFYVGEARHTWLGLLPNGGVMVSIFSKQGEVMRRLRPDGTTDPSFEWNTAMDGIYPLLALPDGSVLLDRSESDEGFPRPVGLRKITSAGSLDPEWLPQLTLYEPKPVKVLRQDDGRLLVLHRHDCQCVSGRLSRLNPDGSLDGTFDASVMDPSAVPALRVSVAGLQPGASYDLEEADKVTGRTFRSVYGPFGLTPNLRQPIELETMPLQTIQDMPQRFWRLRKVD
jgi:hypothetical protein